LTSEQDPGYSGSQKRHNRFLGPPAVRPETLGLDAAACHEASCPHCGQVGMTFVPYHKGDAYRGLAGCERGGEELEL
jgi:hypothetical protein